MHKLVFILALLYPCLAYAYLGPGVGGGIFAATLGLIIAIFAAIFGILWFPIKRYLKKRKEPKKEENRSD